MEYFADNQNWESRESEHPANPARHFSAPEIDLDSFEADLNGSLHNFDEPGMSQQHELQNMLNGQLFSPTLSFQGTPLLSPNAMAPQNVAQRRFSYANHTPQGTPHGTPLMGPVHNVPSAFSPSSTNTAGSVTDYGMYYSKRGSGKFVKNSPAMRWRDNSLTGSISEDEFHLGDPALGDPGLESSLGASMMSEPGIDPGSRRTSAETDEVEERLRSAIAATTRVNSRSSSASSLKSISSRRASLGSNRTTPRIRPKVSVAQGNTDSSPHIRPEAPDLNMHDELFLKSNYQNLVDGTHKHLGLSSAERMSSELRSKKAVHKIAEQERRNRMNLAIQELSRVLGGEEEKSVASKAATVERASKHIKKLQARIADLEARLDESSEAFVSSGNSLSPRSGQCDQ